MARNTDDSFALFLSSSSDRTGLLKAKIPKSKTLTGRYKVSLREIFYKRQLHETWPEEPLYFLMLSNDRDEFEKYRATIHPWSPDSKKFYIASWEESGLPMFKWALVFGFGDYYKAAATPMGSISATKYAGWVNSMMQVSGTLRGFMHGHLQFEYEKAIITVGGSPPENLDKRVVVFPIFGPKTRLLLGYPEPSNKSEFSGLLKLLADPKVEYIAMNHNLKAQTGDIIVTCNILEPNAQKTSAANSDRVLRILPMKDKMVEKAEHSDPIVNRFVGWSELKLPMQVGRYKEIVVQLLQEDTGLEVNFPETVRATLFFSRSKDADDPDMITELIAPKENVITPLTTSVCRYRARVLTENTPGNPDLYMEAPQVNTFVLCSTWDWEKFSKAYTA